MNKHTLRSFFTLLFSRLTSQSRDLPTPQADLNAPSAKPGSHSPDSGAMPAYFFVVPTRELDTQG